MSLLLRLLSPAYLYPVNPSAEGLRAGPLAWALALALGAWAASRWRRRAGGAAEPWAAIACGCAAAGAVLALARTQTGGLLSARVWSAWLTVAALAAALAGALQAAWARLPAAWRAPSQGVGRALCVAGLLLAAAGLATLSARGVRDLWPAIVGAACLAVASLGGRPRRLRPRVLAPFLPACLTLAGVTYLQRQGLDVGPYAAFPAPDPWSPWFDVRVMALAGALGAGIWAIAIASAGAPSATRRLGVAATALGAAFYLASLAVHRPHGATASDPYCYLQMAADLVAHGTVRHRFPLLTVLREQGLATWPAVHVGYHPPPAGDLAATVWPFGWPLLLAPALALAGEAGAIWAAPVWLLGAAVLTLLAPGVLWPSLPRGWAWMCGGLAALILLTSLEGILRTMVPMADAAATTLALVTLLALVRARRAPGARATFRWAAAAGLALGLGYLVRHPQLPLALAALGLLPGRRPWRERLGALAACGAVALVVALPDLAYHRLLSGSYFTPESPEGYLLALGNLRSTVGPLTAEILCRTEFGYLLPFILLGLVGSARRPEERPALGIVLAGLAALALALGAWAASRWRRRAGGAAAPWAAIASWCAAAGAVLALASPHRAAPALAVGSLAVCLAARTATISGLPTYPVWWTFGLVTAEQRAEFARLGADLPADALVLTGLNSGAVERYSGRSTLRPSRWTDDELARFLAWAAAAGRPVYLLEEGEEAAAARTRLQGLAPLRRLGTYALQAHGPGWWPIEGGATLYAVGPPLADRVSGHNP